MEKSHVLIKTNIKTIELVCDIAKDYHDIANGLMGVRSLLDETGMAFLFSEPRRTSFWMLNTHIPLSIAFFDENGKILEIQDMRPLTIDGHSTELPFMGALEMNQGWFAKNNINVGDTITFPSTSAPLMLNEEIYYNDSYAKAVHQGIEVYEDFDNPDKELIPWSEVNNEYITKIYPRSLVNTRQTKTTSLKTSTKIKPENLPGSAAFIERYGIDKFREIDENARQKLGFDSVSGAENVRALTRDIMETYPASRIERGKDWYSEYRKAVDAGAETGISPGVMSASIAIQSPRASWLPRSITNPHSGNQQEPVMQAIVMTRLNSSGLYVPKTIETEFQKTPIIIPAGTHDLSTLNDEQITMLSVLNDGSAIFKGNRKKAIGLMRRDLMGEQFDPEDSLIWFNGPKSNAFYHADRHGDCSNLNCPNRLFNTVVDTHVTNILGKHAIRGSNMSSFINGIPYTNAAEAFLKQKDKPNKPGYEYLASVFENGRFLSSHLDGIVIPKNPHQALNWCGQIIRAPDLSRSHMLARYLDSPSDRMFQAFPDHDVQNDLEEQLHEILNRR